MPFFFILVEKILKSSHLLQFERIGLCRPIIIPYRIIKSADKYSMYFSHIYRSKWLDKINKKSNCNCGS